MRKKAGDIVSRGFGKIQRAIMECLQMFGGVAFLDDLAIEIMRYPWYRLGTYEQHWAGVLRACKALQRRGYVRIVYYDEEKQWVVKLAN